MPPVREYNNSMENAFHSAWTSSVLPSQKGALDQATASFGSTKKPEVNLFTSNNSSTGGSCAKNPCSNGGNPWGDVYKNRQHFNEMHLF